MYAQVLPGSRAHGGTCCCNSISCGSDISAPHIRLVWTVGCVLLNTGWIPIIFIDDLLFQIHASHRSWLLLEYNGNTRGSLHLLFPPKIDVPRCPVFQDRLTGSGDSYKADLGWLRQYWSRLLRLGVLELRKRLDGQ